MLISRKGKFEQKSCVPTLLTTHLKDVADKMAVSKSKYVHMNSVRVFVIPAKRNYDSWYYCNEEDHEVWFDVSRLQRQWCRLTTNIEKA